MAPYRTVTHPPNHHTHPSHLNTPHRLSRAVAQHGRGRHAAWVGPSRSMGGCPGHSCLHGQLSRAIAQRGRLCRAVTQRGQLSRVVAHHGRQIRVVARHGRLSWAVAQHGRLTRVFCSTSAAALLLQQFCSSNTTTAPLQPELCINISAAGTLCS